MRQILIFLAVLCCVCEGVKFGQLCEGNPENTKRVSDGYGSGHYGAPRGAGTHKGLDIKCADKQTVLAPFDVVIERAAKPYGPKYPKRAAIDNGIKMTGGGLCFKLFYIDPVKTSGSVKKGKKIGTMLPMQDVYPKITSHVHVQMCSSKTDPTPYF